MVKNLPAMQETQVRSLGWEDPLEKEMATHSSIPAWGIPWTEEPGCSPRSCKESDMTEPLTLSNRFHKPGRHAIIIAWPEVGNQRVFTQPGKTRARDICQSRQMRKCLFVHWGGDACQLLGPWDSNQMRYNEASTPSASWAKSPSIFGIRDEDMGSGGIRWGSEGVSPVPLSLC